MEQRESKLGGIERGEGDRSPKNDFFRGTINTFSLREQEFSKISRTVVIINKAASVGVQEMIVEVVLGLLGTIEQLDDLCIDGIGD